MEKNKKKNRIILIVLVIVLIILILGSVFFINDILTTNNTSNNKVNDNNQVNNNNTNINENEFDNIENKNDQTDDYIWKMKVSNRDGAKVYLYPYTECFGDVNEEIGNTNCTRVEKDITLDYGTIVNVINDYVDDYNFIESNNYTYEDIKNKYVLKTNYGYISANDLELTNETNFFTNELKENNKYLTINNNVYIYSGPGFLFERVEKIPMGEMLEATYEIGRWKYITYKNYKGWVLEANFNSEDNKYYFTTGDVNTMFDTGYEITVDKDIKIYDFIDGEYKSINIIPKGTTIHTDYEINMDGPGGTTLHITNNEYKGFIYLYFGCEDVTLNDGFLNVTFGDNNKYLTCENE